MKPRYWSLAIVLILVNYLIFATLFTYLMETDFRVTPTVYVSVPTFTPAPAEPMIIIPTSTPATPKPTPTATKVLAPSESDAASTADTIQANVAQPANPPQLVAPGAVNIRAGPGLSYEVIGRLNPNTVMPIIGRNADVSWWQIEITDGTTGWVSNQVVEAINTENVPITKVSAIPASVSAQPAAIQPLPTPKYQFEPTGWWDDGNAGLTRFLGEIHDVNGNPVNGVFIQASCGDYSVISNPSGPIGYGPYNESEVWPPGFYDLTVDTRPVPCIWTLTVVDTSNGQVVKGILSESIPVEVTLQKSIIVANWRKNW